MAQQETFESIEQNHSPLLAAQPDYHDALGMESFNLAEQQQQHLQQRISPTHSPYTSPMVRPAQGPVMGPETNFVLTQHMKNQFSQAPGPEMYAGNPMGFHNRNGSADLGQVIQMGAPLEINVQFAPSERTNSFELGKQPGDREDLSPPARSKSR